jgi:hypothetical protein
VKETTIKPEATSVHLKDFNSFVQQNAAKLSRIRIERKYKVFIVNQTPLYKSQSVL